MKCYFFIIAFSFNLVAVFAQSTNLGNTYIQSENLLISFDKVMYPGYVLKLENIKHWEYLLGKLIFDTTYEKSVLFEHLETQNKTNKYELILDMEPLACSKYAIQEQYTCLEFELLIDISSNSITNETYLHLPEGFQLISLDSEYYKRVLNLDTKGDISVEYIEVTKAIDYEFNKIRSEEIPVFERPKEENEIVDIDGNIYQTTRIGSQIWMSENLRAVHFNDGTTIADLSAVQWANTTAPCITSNNTDGNFYNFYTLVSNKNVCPQGFHVPTQLDISKLYNSINPYEEKLKITTSEIKKNVYSPALTPIAVPLLSAVNLGWWAGATTINIGLFGLSGIADLSLWSLQLLSAGIDATLLSPFLGWDTKNKQHKKNLKMARKYRYIDTNGIPLIEQTDATGKHTLSPSTFKSIDKEDWKNFIVTGKIESGDSSMGYQVISDKNIIDSLTSLHVNHQYTFKYRPFSLSKLYAKKFWITTKWLWNSDYIQVHHGFFGMINVLPFRSLSLNNDYTESYYNCSYGRGYHHQPVVTLLSSKKNNEFADEYNFSLSDNNYISFPPTRGKYSSAFSFEGNKNQIVKTTGISFVNKNGLPGFFGISSKIKDTHELNLLNSIDPKSVPDIELLKMQTKIRCVND